MALSRDALLQQALDALERDDPATATAFCHRVLAADPLEPDALNLLGVIAARAGRFAEAVEWMERLLSQLPDNPAVHFNVGNLRQSLHQWPESVSCYQRALTLNPAYAEAYLNLAASWLEMGRAEEALPALDAALRLQPELIDGWINRGVALQALQRWAEALVCYEHVLSKQPGQADAWNNRGIVLDALGRMPEALACYESALRLQPRNVDALFNRGNAFKAMEQWDRALDSYARALAIDTHHARAWNNRGVVLKAVGRWTDAVASFEQAIAANAAYAEAYLNRGNTLQSEPATAGVALASFEEAVRINPDYADAHLNLALCRLLTGDFKGGWPGYEWRWQQEPRQQREFTQPRWHGERSLHGLSILLHSEQGLGDTLQFCRYAALVAALGARVILEVPRPLAPLLHDLAGVSLLVERGTPLPDFDCHCPLLSLPLALKTELANIPAPPAYLHADALKVDGWQRRLGPPAAPRIGLAWSGNSAHKNDRNRSLPLAQLISRLPHGPCYVSLQKEIRAADEASLRSRTDVLHFGELLEDFSDTAALCQCMDLIISVDTSVAHLAGALGRPVWILLPSPPDWRWLLERTDSPWYPSAKLYRQAICGDWQDVLSRVSVDLLDAQWSPV